MERKTDCTISISDVYDNSLSCYDAGFLLKLRRFGEKNKVVKRAQKEIMYLLHNNKK